MNALKNPSLVLLLSLALFAGCHNMGSNLDEFNQPVYIPGYATGFDIRKADGKESTLISVTDPWQGADSVSTWLYVARDGECQRIMIARALAQSTPVILLDEPTSFLDMPNRYELCTLLSRLAHEERRCILFSTHELDIALTLADSVALIDTPELLCMPAEEMRRNGSMERLFRNEHMTKKALTFL